jgi:copper chaperone
MLKSISFEVMGEKKINCQGCEERIESALKKLEGVSKVRAHARTQRIEVLLDTTLLEPSAIIDKLGQAGYEAKATA